MQIGQVSVPLGDVEAVADKQLVGHREADVTDRQIVHEAAVRPVEECYRCERGGVAEAQRLAEVVQRQTGVDHVLDDEDVAVGDLQIEVLEQADPPVPARVGVRAVTRELDEVDRVRDRNRAGEIGEEDEARLERCDEQRLAAGVVTCDLAAELGDARRQLPPREVDLADCVPRRYFASSRRYR